MRTFRTIRLAIAKIIAPVHVAAHKTPDLEIGVDVVSDLLDILGAEYEADPESADLKSWRKVMDRAHDFIQRASA